MLISDKQKQILTLLADGEFHSGTELAEVLGVSRSAICKQLNGLSALGLQHAAVSGKGYRLEQPLELLEPFKINSLISEANQAVLSVLEVHDTLPSTNSYLADLAQKNAPSGYACFAEHQTAGKGRRGRQWVSPYGCNLYLSVLWRFQQGGIASTSGLSLAIGVAVIRVLKSQGFAEVGLKWPNDIYCHGKKLGGILIEVSGESDGPCSVVIGLGLNLALSESQGQEITQDWTDLKQINAGDIVSRNALAGAILNELISIVNGYEQGGIAPYIAEWRSYDCLKGQPAVLYIGQQIIEGVVDGINEQGLLLLKKHDESVQAYASGEVSFSASGL
ncbi:MAG: bifunctional biotin--[acetyl-CoA-carboxylase] ligase/biotin operon repressor BirA [Methylococcales bacterium]|nr:bifunctional biotin--[acetyl-CoA-carboxylase] ligase/biotin operon repressor BirA [Methylococcales bacterium]